MIFADARRMGESAASWLPYSGIHNFVKVDPMAQLTILRTPKKDRSEQATSESEKSAPSEPDLSDQRSRIRKAWHMLTGCCRKPPDSDTESLNNQKVAASRKISLPTIRPPELQETMKKMIIPQLPIRGQPFRMSIAAKHAHSSSEKHDPQDASIHEHESDSSTVYADALSDLDEFEEVLFQDNEIQPCPDHEQPEQSSLRDEILPTADKEDQAVQDIIDLEKWSPPKGDKEAVKNLIESPKWWDTGLKSTIKSIVNTAWDLSPSLCMYLQERLESIGEDTIRWFHSRRRISHFGDLQKTAERLRPDIEARAGRKVQGALKPSTLDRLTEIGAVDKKALIRKREEAIERSRAFEAEQFKLVEAHRERAIAYFRARENRPRIKRGVPRKSALKKPQTEQPQTEESLKKPIKPKRSVSFNTSVEYTEVQQYERKGMFMTTRKGQS